MKPGASCKDYEGDPAIAPYAEEVNDGETVPDDTPYLCSGNRPGVEGSGTDNSRILKKNGKIYLVCQFECENGGMYMAELDQNK